MGSLKESTRVHFGCRVRTGLGVSGLRFRAWGGFTSGLKLQLQTLKAFISVEGPIAEEFVIAVYKCLP